MPFLQRPDAQLHYEISGADHAPWLILSNSLGVTLEMWQPQLPELRKHFRVLRYDTRGHGGSSVPPGPYRIEQLGEDVIALMDGLSIARAHFCGLSMGGMTGIWFGVHHPARLERLVLCNTAALIGPREAWDTRIAKANAEGMAAIVPAIIERWFTPGFTARAPQQVGAVRNMLLATDKAGYAANCAAVRDMDQRATAGSIKAPTLVIAGTHDNSTPAADGKWLAEQIAGARYVELDAAHLSNWEQAEQFTRELVNFLRAEGTGARHG